MLTLVLIGVAIGILLTVSSVKIAIAGGRYLWKNAFALLVVLGLILLGMSYSPPEPPKPRHYNTHLQPED